MKNLFLSTLATLTGLAVSAPLASAQNHLTARVPFAFGINANTVLPAGDYVVSRAGVHWQLRNWATRETFFVDGSTEQSKSSDPSRLVFDCRGSRCALREIVPGYGHAGSYLPPSRSRSLEISRVISIPLGRAEGN